MDTRHATRLFEFSAFDAIVRASRFPFEDFDPDMWGYIEMWWTIFPTESGDVFVFEYHWNEEEIPRVNTLFRLERSG